MMAYRKFPVFLCVILLASCTPSLASEINRNAQRWKDAAPTSYQIEVLHVRSIWHAQSYLITVVDGKVTESSSSCVPAPMEFGECKVEPFDPNDFIVPALFELARSKAQGSNPQYLTIRFNQQYGYPEQIVFDNPQAIDDDTSWIVKNFRPSP